MTSPIILSARPVPKSQLEFCAEYAGRCSRSNVTPCVTVSAENWAKARRAILIGPYIAFYRVEAEVVFVQRILHGARHITPGLLGGV